MQCGAQYASQYKKRKHSESPNNTLSKGTAMPPYVGMPFIKQEPSGRPPPEYSLSTLAYISTRIPCSVF